MSEERRLYDHTRDLLRNVSKQKTLQDVANETGVPLQWLKRLSSGDLDPTHFDRIEELYQHLSGRKLL